MNECLICSTKINKMDSVIIYIDSGKCNHGKHFHLNCINAWLNRENSNTTCPLCRKQVVCIYPCSSSNGSRCVDDNIPSSAPDSKAVEAEYN